jgi:hypothetical protein
LDGPTNTGYEAMAMMRKGQVWNISGSDIMAQATFIVRLRQVAVCEVNWSFAYDPKPTPNVPTQPDTPPGEA